MDIALKQEIADLLRNKARVLSNRCYHMSDIFWRVWTEFGVIRMWKAHCYLRHIKRDQREKFDVLKKRFAKVYSNIKYHDIRDFVTTPWWNINVEIEKVFLPSPPFNFLRNSVIQRTMFVMAGSKWLNKELSFLQKRYSKMKLRSLLIEDYVGDPLLLNSEYITSHNSIHHLYHLVRYSQRAKCNLNGIRVVVDWGGGYGNMAKIFKRLVGSNNLTFIIIDIPIFSCLQWLYLATVLGEETVHLLQTPEDNVRVGKVNLLPVCFVSRYNITADLFISTWGLSESSVYTQDYVIASNWFRAKHILLAYQDSCKELPYADRIGKLAEGSGAVIEDIKFLPGNHYAFR